MFRGVLSRYLITVALVALVLASSVYAEEAVEVTDPKSSTGETFVVGVMEEDGLFYHDRPFLMRGIPEEYLGLTNITTSCDTLATVGDEWTFEIDRPAYVYIGLDDRWTPPEDRDQDPEDWFNDAFTKTGESVILGPPHSPTDYWLYKSNDPYPKGKKVYTKEVEIDARSKKQRSAITMICFSPFAESFQMRFTCALFLLAVISSTILVAAETDGPGHRIYSLAKKGTYKIPPELDNFKKTWSPLKLVNAEEFGFEPKDHQSDPSRVIYHGGKYHCWMIDGYNHRYKNDGKSWILYMTSEDTYNWTAVGYIPLGPKGSCYDLAIEQANVVYHEGKFYLFSEGWTTNIEKYGQRRAGILCLVANSPEGPWKKVGDLLVKPETDEGKSWDNVHVNNPRHVYLNGKWLMYYKSRRKPKEKTTNGLAIANSLTGPYKKYEGNPLLRGHGHFCWRYKHGMLMLPFANDTILWSEDGIHFTPPLATGKEKLFIFGSLYVPYDPLCGKPVTDKPVTEYWGFESCRNTPTGATSSNWDVVRIEWEFGPSERRK